MTILDLSDNPSMETPECVLQHDLVIANLGGYCPVQGDGWVGGKPFYFRARGDRWSFAIADCKHSAVDAVMGGPGALTKAAGRRYNPAVQQEAFQMMIRTIASLLACISVSSAAEVFIDGTKPGQVFEGIGALSAGASSKLLADYPEPQRALILDYLFKPKFGASLQHLKVEIGGDVNSTCGTEPSHARTREEFENFKPEYLDRGYEPWLMKEARKRNPQVVLESLQWGAPYWIGNGKFYSQDNADFIALFHKGLRDHHDLAVNYQGIWNETKYDADWIKLLRRTLDSKGLGDVRIVGADQTGLTIWHIADEMLQDDGLANAIDVIGEHYNHYDSNDAARTTGKRVWAAEDGPWAGDWHGSTKIARLLNRNYIEGKCTKTITWSLITSYYGVLPLPNSGLMKAAEPWSGHFVLEPAMWVVAHTTQFAEPGWQYIDGGCGYIKNTGSYVTLRSPDGKDLSIVIETMDSPYLHDGPRPRPFRLRLSADFPRRPLHLWRSDSETQFVKEATLQPAADGSVLLRLRSDCVYTLTTTTGQQKGEGVRPPASAPLALPYRDGFEAAAIGRLPRLFMDQSGVFEVTARADGKGRCIQQVVPQKGIEWRFHKNPAPETILGDSRWRDYEVAADVSIPANASATLFARVSKVTTLEVPPVGYSFTVTDKGQWTLAKNATLKQPAVLASGQTQLPVGQWHRISLRVAGDRLTPSANGTPLANVTDSEYPSGLVGLGCSWHSVAFDNVEVLAVPQTGP